MKVETFNKDIAKFRKALDIIASTESMYMTKKPYIMNALYEQICLLEDKRDRQIKILAELKNS